MKHFSNEGQTIHLYQTQELKAGETEGFSLSHRFLMQYLSPILQVACALRNEGREDPSALPDPYSTGLGLGPTSLLLCIAEAFNALHWKLSPPKSNQKCYSDRETKDERRKLWGNEGHQASNFLNTFTLFFSRHMLSEAEEAIGSTFTAPWSSVYVSASISVWCVYWNCVRSYTVSAWGFSMPGLPEDLIFPIKSSWAPWICCKEGDEMLSGKV